VQAFYDDNVRLDPMLQQSSFDTIVHGDAVVGRRSEVTDLKLDAAAVWYRYFDVPELNTTNAYLTFDAKHRTEHYQSDQSNRVQPASRATKALIYR
jgi:hypothetical protein